MLGATREGLLIAEQGHGQAGAADVCARAWARRQVTREAHGRAHEEEEAKGAQGGKSRRAPSQTATFRPWARGGLRR